LLPDFIADFHCGSKAFTVKCSPVCNNLKVPDP
jgi:predicted deacylase